jgi:ribonuclease III
MLPEMENLEAVIGYRFEDREILHRALTHRSHVHEHGRPLDAIPALLDNEQLEFLGDSVLGFVVSEHLVRSFPSFSEGRLSKLRAHLVSAVHLYSVARNLGLGEHLRLGRGEELSGGRSKRTLLVDALEALIAAIYLDGGFETAREFVNRFISIPGLAADNTEGDQGAPTPADYKSALQELAQARKLPPPRYLTVKEQGPEHAKTFTVEVRLGREWSGQAEGLSKKSAAQNAARDVLAKLGQEGTSGGRAERLVE